MPPRRAGEPVSLATVYNTLRAFCEAGLLQEITVDGSKSYFDTRTEDHPHFYWEDTGELTDAPAADLKIARLPDAARRHRDRQGRRGDPPAPRLAGRDVDPATPSRIIAAGCRRRR